MPTKGSPDVELQKARVLSITSEVEQWLGLTDDRFRIVHLFNEQEVEEALASTQAKWQYMYAEITWNLYRVMAVEDLSIYKTAVHECVHVLMSAIDKYLPEKPWIVDANEFATESITHALLRALRTPPPNALG